MVYGGGKDFEGTIDPGHRKRGFELTVLELDKEHWDDDSLMNECVFPLSIFQTTIHLTSHGRELFGPFLPVLPVEDVDEAIQFVSSRCANTFFHIYVDGLTIIGA